jgi:uncharacterized membrane protein YbjE (DUF340 family)
MKKESPAWNIAATHFLTATIIPFLISLATGFVLRSTGMDIGSVATMLLSNLIWVIGIWAGVMYSANYLAEHYIITDANKIINLSTTYRFILFLLFIGGGLFMASSQADTSVDKTGLAFTVSFAVIGIIVFYLASKKYIKQDGQVSGNL